MKLNLSLFELESMILLDWLIGLRINSGCLISEGGAKDVLEMVKRSTFRKKFENILRL